MLMNKGPPTCKLNRNIIFTTDFLHIRQIYIKNSVVYFRSVVMGYTILFICDSTEHFELHKKCHTHTIRPYSFTSLLYLYLPIRVCGLDSMSVSYRSFMCKKKENIFPYRDIFFLIIFLFVFFFPGHVVACRENFKNSTNRNSTDYKAT